jgi:hypothetical protein
MISTKGRKVTRPGGMTGANNNEVKVNVPSSDRVDPPPLVSRQPFSLLVASA